MTKKGLFKDARLLEALDYIDRDLVGEVAVKLRFDDASSLTEEPVITWRTPFKHWKSLATLAACILLLSIASPLVGYIAQVIADWGAAAGVGTTEELSDNETTTDHLTQTDYVYGPYLNPIKDLEPLPKGLLEEIDSKSEVGFSSFSVLNKGVTNSDRYLGYIGGYYVFFDTSAGDKPGSYIATTSAQLHVAGYDFYYKAPFGILLHKDGVNITLKEAYESGQITLEDVRKIYCRNNEYIRYFNPELNFKDKVPITEKEYNEMRDAWIAKFNESEHFPKEFEWTFGSTYSCYGHIGENIIFLARNPDSEEAYPMINFEIEGYTFSEYSTSIWVYHYGEIMQLRAAHNSGLVTSEDLQTISYMNQYTFGKIN